MYMTRTLRSRRPVTFIIALLVIHRTLAFFKNKPITAHIQILAHNWFLEQGFRRCFADDNSQGAHTSGVSSYYRFFEI